MLLSIGMMVKNEEKYLDMCLSSLMPILNNIDSELIIVDTGSTDNTVEIAKKYTDKVYFHKWNNNFSEIRNVTISYCKGEWFFYIDGDEIIDDCNEIINFFKSGEYKNYKSATIYIKNLVDLNDRIRYSIFSPLRLFKKEKSFKFINAVHNQPLFSKPIKCIPAFCTHYGYISTDKELMERKYKRTASILKNELEKNPESVYYLYQLSVSYNMHNDYDEAVDSAQKAYDIIIRKKENFANYPYMLPQLCMCYHNKKDYLNEEKYALESLKYDKSSMDIYYYLGIASMLLKKYEQSISSFKSYLDLNKSYYSSNNSISSAEYTLNRVDEVYYKLYVLSREIGDYDEAEKYLLSVKSIKYNVPACMVDLCISTRKYHQIKKYEEYLISKNKFDNVAKLYNALETKKIAMEEEDIKELTKIFSVGDMLYNHLNVIRMAFQNNKKINMEEINSLLSKINLADEEFYYGDLIYYTMLSGHDISGMLKDSCNEKIISYFEYLSKKYQDLSTCIYDYLLKFIENDDFQSLRINKELCRYIILLSKVEEDKLHIVYGYYLKTGTTYIKLVYSSAIFENEHWQAIRTQEERFFMYMSKAVQYKNKDEKYYIRYLKLSLHAFPPMKDLISYLLNEEEKQTAVREREFESYRAQVKSSIKSLIDNGKYDDAKSIINEYKKIKPDDVEVYSMEAIAEIMKKDFVTAEKTIKTGLNIDKNNFDLLYNLGYLYNIENRKAEAIASYTIAKKVCDDEECKNQIEQMILNISGKY